MARVAGEVDLSSPRDVRRFLEERGITLKKRWGQNFLFQEHYRRWIVELLAPEEGQEIWEIGPGLGSLTDGLVASGAAVTLFEIDHGLIELLRERFGEAVTVVAGDAVRECVVRLQEGLVPEKVVGNLPYSSGAKIIASFVESPLPAPPAMIVMVQREVAERMIAEPGGEEYSSFTVLVASAYEARLEGDVPPSAFLPAPRVRSTVVRLTPKAEVVAAEQRRALSTVTRALFTSRRKTARNGLRRAFEPEQAGRLVGRLEELGFSGDQRGEEFPLEVYLALAKALLDE